MEVAKEKKTIKYEKGILYSISFERVATHLTFKSYQPQLLTSSPQA